MKNREIIEYVPREGWEKWRRRQKLKNEISFWITYVVFFVLMFLLVRVIF